MHPGKAPRLHHLLQGGTGQSLGATGDIQWVSGVWLHGSSSYGKQRMNACAGTYPGSPPEKKMGIECSNTAEVHFDNGKAPAGNLPGGLGKVWRWQSPSLKRMRECGGLVLWHKVAQRRCRTESSSGCSGLSVPTRDSSTEFSWDQHWCGDGAGAFTRSCCRTTCTRRRHLSSPSPSYAQPPH